MGFNAVGNPVADLKSQDQLAKDAYDGEALPKDARFQAAGFPGRTPLIRGTRARHSRGSGRGQVTVVTDEPSKQYLRTVVSDHGVWPHVPWIIDLSLYSVLPS